MKVATLTVLAASFLLAAPTLSSASPRGRKGAVRKAASQRTKPQRKLTKQQKIRAFFKMVRAMGKVPKSCRLKGKKLWGKVKIVKSWPDFKVKIVNSWPDLKVKWVNSWPDKCGKWKKVKSWPDFKIKFVKSWPDFTIKIVKSWPGVK